MPGRSKRFFLFQDPLEIVRQGRLHLIPTLVAAWLGAVCGITLSYFIGRTLGVGFVHRYGRWLHVTQEDVTRVEQWLEHSGRWTLMFGYYIPGVRHLTAIVAGSTELPPRTFARYAYSGAGIWSLSFITLGLYVGKRWETALRLVHQHIAVSVIVLAIPGIAYIFVHRWWVRRHRTRN